MKTKNKKKKFEQAVKSPTESPGSYYVRKGRNNNWYLWLETYLGGKKKQRPVEQARFHDLGLTKTMTLVQARARVREINKLGKQEKLEYKARIFSAKRAEWQKAVDKIYFPPEIMENFLEDIRDTPGIKTKYQNRLVRCFEVITEMIPSHVQILPHQYNSSIKKVVNYFCKQKYSISYSSDIIMVMNMWAKHYAKHKGVYADLIEKVPSTYRKAINEEHNKKEKNVRKQALPIQRLDLENCYKKIDKTNDEEMSFYRWIRASWLFGLRPSELDRFILGDQEENRTEYDKHNGVTCLVVKQTKAGPSYKRIPVLSKEQAEALEDILNKPTQRPTPDWIDSNLRRKDHDYRQKGLKFDCYSGRKGYIDLMLSKEYGQKLENISVWMGHSSITTSYTHYKNRNDLFFDETEYNLKNKRPLKIAG